MERLSLFISDMIIIEFIIMFLFFLYNFLENNTHIFFFNRPKSIILKIKNLLSRNSHGILFVFIMYTFLIKAFIMLCNCKW